MRSDISLKNSFKGSCADENLKLPRDLSTRGVYRALLLIVNNTLYAFV